LHAGLLEGALQQAGVRFRTEPMRNYPEYGCAYRLLAN
jgi:hypothetical protein